MAEKENPADPSASRNTPELPYRYAERRFAHQPLAHNPVMQKLGTLLGERKIAPKDVPAAHNLNLQDLGETPIMAAGEIEKVQQTMKEILAWVERNTSMITESAERMAKVFGEMPSVGESNRSLLLEQVLESDAMIRKFIASAKGGEAKERFILSYVKSLVKHIPENRDATRFVADVALTLGFFTEAKPNAPHEQIVRVAVTGENGRVGRKDLTTNFPGSKGLLKEFQEKVVKAALNHRRNEEFQAEQLRKDAKPYLDALTEGGEASAFVPDETRGGRDFRGGWIRIRVMDGEVQAMRAVGGCERIFAEIAESEIAIPVASVKNERPCPKQRDDWRLVGVFHALLHRAWIFESNRQLRLEEEKKRAEERREEHEKRQEAIELMRGAETLKPEEFFRGVHGTTSLFVRNWKDPNGMVHHYVPFLAERGPEGKVRLLSCLPEHEAFFEKSAREFQPKNPEKIPGNFGAMLRLLEGVFKRLGTNQTNAMSGAKPKENIS